jgi:hypothetical protein
VLARGRRAIPAPVPAPGSLVSGTALQRMVEHREPRAMTALGVPLGNATCRGIWPLEGFKLDFRRRSRRAFSLLAANIVNEREKPTAQPTPKRPQAKNTSAWVVVCAFVQPPDDNSESSRPTGREWHHGRTQRRGVRL